MKKLQDIDREIDSQVKALEKKGVKPAVLIMGSMSYYTLKISLPKEQIEQIDNFGVVLKEYKGLRVIQKPSFEHGGIFKAEQESIEVFGN